MRRAVLSGELSEPLPRSLREEAETAHRAPRPRFDVAMLVVSLTRRTVDLKHQKEIKEEVPLEPEVLLGTSMLCSMVPLISRVRSLEAGETQKLMRKMPELFPKFILSDQTLTVKRVEDGDLEGSSGGNSGPGYRIKVVSINASYDTFLSLDETGRLKTYLLKQQLGDIVYQRIEK